ncbi:hypothetical protein KJ644_01190 [Candidatus Dependentiae bacterium]|nr:hypothetical protein [Candidatus Dependentiae bacterium]MBU4387065.1 hypothetical protein [Candidatus Dependentiae bacterium]MCG2756217.1 hypothetical protein [Candidatus Dependentiae bacterium]
MKSYVKNSFFIFMFLFATANSMNSYSKNFVVSEIRNLLDRLYFNAVLDRLLNRENGTLDIPEPLVDTSTLEVLANFLEENGDQVKRLDFKPDLRPENLVSNFKNLVNLIYEVDLKRVEVKSDDKILYKKKELLKKILNNTKSLEELTIKLSELGYYGIEVICEFIRENKTLKKLDIRYSFVSSNALKILLKALSENNSLEILILRGNTLTAGNIELGKAFSKMLLNNSTIKKIDLMGCNLKSHVVKKILKSLIYNNTLKKINLIGSFSSDDYYDALSEVLKNNICLEKICIELNKKAKKESIENFTKALKLNSNVTLNYDNPGILEVCLSCLRNKLFNQIKLIAKLNTNDDNNKFKRELNKLLKCFKNYFNHQSECYNYYKYNSEESTKNLIDNLDGITTYKYNSEELYDDLNSLYLFLKNEEVPDLEYLKSLNCFNNINEFLRLRDDQFLNDFACFDF